MVCLSVMFLIENSYIFVQIRRKSNILGIRKHFLSITQTQVLSLSNKYKAKYIACLESKEAISNQLPKGILRSAVPLPCFFDVVKSQKVAGQRAQQGTKSRRIGRKFCLSANPSCGWSTRPSSKGSQGQLEGSEGLPEEFVGLPERAEGLTEGSAGLTEESLVLQRGQRSFQIGLETFREA